MTAVTDGGHTSRSWRDMLQNIALVKVELVQHSEHHNRKELETQVFDGL